MIVPSFRSGLREHLIRCAGAMTETHHSHQNSSGLSFITVTTPGNLPCQKVLFVNWSLPQQPTPMEILLPSIQFFLTQLFQYLAKQEQASMAMAIPELSYDEQKFSEGFLEELINQMHSLESRSFQISLIFLPNQEKLHQTFNETLRLYHQTDNHDGIFYCPSTGQVSAPP